MRTRRQFLRNVMSPALMFYKRQAARRFLEQQRFRRSTGSLRAVRQSAAVQAPVFTIREGIMSAALTVSFRQKELLYIDILKMRPEMYSVLTLFR